MHVPDASKWNLMRGFTQSEPPPLSLQLRFFSCPLGAGALKTTFRSNMRGLFLNSSTQIKRRSSRVWSPDFCLFSTVVDVRSQTWFNVCYKTIINLFVYGSFASILLLSKNEQVYILNIGGFVWICSQKLQWVVLRIILIWKKHWFNLTCLQVLHCCTA